MHYKEYLFTVANILFSRINSGCYEGDRESSANKKAARRPPLLEKECDYLREPPLEDADGDEDDELCMEPVFIELLFIELPPPPNDDPLLRALDDPPFEDPLFIEEKLRAGAELGKLCVPPDDPRIAEIEVPLEDERNADCPGDACPDDDGRDACPGRGRAINSPVTGFMPCTRVGIGVVCTFVLTAPSCCTSAFTLLKL